jgi:hypothetical protein
MVPTLSSHPLTSVRWADFETLFGKNGACGGCWCMLSRLPCLLVDPGQTLRVFRDDELRRHLLFRDDGFRCAAAMMFLATLPG